jgi:hypothetical protein
MEPHFDASVKAVERLLRYSAFHAEYLSRFVEGEDLKFHLDHFLLTLTAAAQNIIGLAPNGRDGSWINAPTALTLRTNPSLQAVCWAWYARNHVAHSYVTLVWSDEAELTFGDGFGTLNGSAINAVLKIELQPVEDDEGNAIFAPEAQPHEVAEESLSFWRSALAYVLMKQKQERYTYTELANHWKASR